MKVKSYKKHYIKNNRCTDCGKLICDCAKKCGSCATKKNQHRLIDGRTMKKYYCIACKKEISYQSGFYGDRRCKSCANSLAVKILFKNPENNPNYIDGRSLIKHPCKECGKLINWQSIRCQPCYWKYLLPKLMTGKNHPNWQEGISNFPYPFEFNNELKKLIQIRDNYTCQLCNKKGNTIHHIDYNKSNCSENNLITTCKSCNSKINFNRDYWFAYFTYLIREKGESNVKNSI